MIQIDKKDWISIQDEAGQLLTGLKYQIQDVQDEVNGMIQKWNKLTGWDGSVYYDLNDELRPEAWDDCRPEEMEALDAAVVVMHRWKIIRGHLSAMREQLANDLTTWTGKLDDKIKRNKC